MGFSEVNIIQEIEVNWFEFLGRLIISINNWKNQLTEKFLENNFNHFEKLQKNSLWSTYSTATDAIVDELK